MSFFIEIAIHVWESKHNIKMRKAKFKNYQEKTQEEKILAHGSRLAYFSFFTIILTIGIISLGLILIPGRSCSRLQVNRGLLPTRAGKLQRCADITRDCGKWGKSSTGQMWMSHGLNSCRSILALDVASAYRMCTRLSCDSILKLPGGEERTCQTSLSWLPSSSPSSPSQPRRQQPWSISSCTLS